MGLGCRCHPAHAIQGQKRQYDLACRLTALVDVRMKDGKLEKKLKVSLNDFGFLPKQPAIANRQENDPDITAEPAPPPTEVLDGDRESLPE